MTGINYVSIIGAQRCGTTYLYHLLDEHPQIYMAKPVKPEPKHFIIDDEYRKGKEYYLNKYFSDCGSEIKCIGEKGTSYIEYEKSANRIFSFFDNAKIIIMLRNPVERALSNYFFSVQNKLENRTPEDVFLNRVPAPLVNYSVSVNPFDYIKRSRYELYLQPYLSNYSQNVKVIVLEELVDNVKVLSDIYRFLETDNKFIPSSYSKKINSVDILYSNSVSASVLKALKSELSSSIKIVEDLLSKQINYWND